MCANALSVAIARANIGVIDCCHIAGFVTVGACMLVPMDIERPMIRPDIALTDGSIQRI